MPSSDTQFKPGHAKTPGCGRKRKAITAQAGALQDKVADIVLSRLDRLLDHMDRQYQGTGQTEANDTLLKLAKLVMPKPLPLDRYIYDDDDNDETAPPCA